VQCDTKQGGFIQRDARQSAAHSEYFETGAALLDSTRQRSAVS
jgi:hypothetical protein